MATLTTTPNRFRNVTRGGSLLFATLLFAAVGCQSNPTTPANSSAGTGSSASAVRPADQASGADRDGDAKSGAGVSVKSDGNDANEKHSWTDQQILTCTVSQCWHLANDKEEEFFDIVQKLAAISAKDRNLVLPESAEAGRKAGELIKSRAKGDHEQLLYAIVDEAIRKVGQPVTSNEAAQSGKPSAGR